MKDFTDKTVLVTGGAGGIGRATIEKFLEGGADIEYWDLNKGEIGTSGEYSDNIYFREVDVSDSDAVNKAMADLKDRRGGLDVLINNAGITRDATLKKMSEEDWHKVIDINLSGVFYCGQAAAGIMCDQESGVILNASSVVGLYGNFGQSNYVASKSGVIGLTKTWARELGRKGIRVNAVAPGFVNTEMVKTVPDDVLDDLKNKTPLGRLGEAEDVASAYYWLASEEASFITGAVIQVDGGLIL